MLTPLPEKTPPEGSPPVNSKAGVATPQIASNLLTCVSRVYTSIVNPIQLLAGHNPPSALT
ncbi:MAG: Uncharacterised protein [Crocinitomicaceae bacterium]|nr:MAG: Uncharacterised protein [Crocinitomicaceae bacterium]